MGISEKAISRKIIEYYDCFRPIDFEKSHFCIYKKILRRILIGCPKIFRKIIKMKILFHKILNNFVRRRKPPNFTDCEVEVL